jgi:hypothetical protein
MRTDSVGARSGGSTIIDGDLTRATSERARSTLPAWPTAVIAGGVILYAIAPRENLLPSGIVALVVYGSAMYVFPASRPRRDLALSPAVWAVGLFGLTMVVCPILVAFFGPARSVLPSLPSSAAIDLALITITVAFIAFCASFAVVYGWLIKRPRDPSREWFQRSLPPRLTVLFVWLGLLGLVLSFGSPEDLVAFLTTPAERAVATEEASFAGLLGLVLRPFLGFGLIAIWCRSVDLSTGHRRSARGTLLLVMIGTLLSYGTFGFNRASIAYPLVGVVAVYNKRVRRIGVAALVGLGAVSLLLLGSIGVYRGGSFTATEFLGDPGRLAIREELDLNQEIQVYGGAPQFLAFVMNQAEQIPPRWGGALVSGLASPIPRLGEPFRGTSGTGLYNRWIYGSSDVRDQVIPFAGELFIDLRLLGVVMGFLALGALVAMLQVAFLRTTTALGAFVAQYVGMWIAFPIVGSAEVVSQIFVYFMWPIYVSLGYLLLRSRNGPLMLESGLLHTRA